MYSYMNTLAPINCKIDPHIENLNFYHSIYPWIPNEYQIRPTEKNIRMKEKNMNVIQSQYHSIEDYIHINIFNSNLKILNNKYLAIEKNKDISSFQVCPFKYQLHPDTLHYILWYSTDIGLHINDEKITSDIQKYIYTIIKNDKFSFVWYENPKMSIPEIYHVHVFWIKNSS